MYLRVVQSLSEFYGGLFYVSLNSFSELGADLALTSAYMLRLQEFSLVNRKVNI